MQNYLPSKKFIKTILLTIVFGLSIFFIGKIFSKNSIWENKKNKNVPSQNLAGDYFLNDKDGDGLYDWEEALWGTNPNMKDSDGNGIPDKEEIDSKRKNIDIDETYKPNDNNETEVFAKQLFTTSAILSQSGGFSQDNLDEFGRGVGSSIQNFTVKDKYLLSDLKLSAVSAGDYYNNFYNLYNSLPNKDIPELYVISKLLENPNDESVMNDLSKIVAMYQKFIDGLLVMKVPYNNAGSHLNLINNFHKLSEIISSTRLINEDPLKVTTYLSKYREYTENIEINFKNLSLYFSQNGII